MQILSSMLGWLYSKHILDVMTPMFGKTSHKMGKKCPDMTIDVDWDVKQQIKQTNHFLRAFRISSMNFKYMDF